MNTTNATNATPTPAAPLTPEPPKCCPACGCTEFRDHEARIYFKCGEVWQWGKEWWKTCDNAFSAAIALRQKLADEKTANECLQDELTVLRAERDAAMAQVKMLSDNEGGALTFNILRTWEREKLERFCLHLLGDDWQTLTARAEQAELSRDQLSDGLHVVTVQLTAARARLAELQAVCDAAIAWNLLYRVLPSREFWYGERAKLARENLSNAVNKYRDESETK